MVAETKIGSTVPVEIFRNGKSMTVNVKLAQMHESEVAEEGEHRRPAAKWGMSVQTLTPQIAQQLGINPESGVVVTQVSRDSAADNAGLQSGDVILKLDHQKLSSSEDFTRIARKDQSAGKSALALVQRGDHTIYTVINPNA